VQLLYTTSGWPVTLKACGIVQPNCPFFHACSSGDIETIKFILSNQQASIYDRDPEGRTAFQYAISNSQLEVCKLLRQAGIFAQFDDDDYRHSLNNIQTSVNDFTEHNLSLLRVAAPLDNPDGDWFEEYCETSINDYIIMAYADIGLLSLLNSAQSDTAMLTISHLKAYFEFESRNIYGSGLFGPYIVRVLSSISAIQEISAARDRHTWIVYALANAIARENLRQNDLLLDKHQVRQTLCAVVRAGLNPHQISGKLELPWIYRVLSMTPLGLLCVAAFEGMRDRWESRHWTRSQWSQDVNAKMQAWLSGFYSAGIDLLQYAESESAYYACSPDSLAIPWDTESRIMVVTGPRPGDWHVSLWQSCESYARLFWCWAEEEPVVPRLTAKILETFLLPTSQNPKSPDLPGSWPSEEARVVEKLESWLLIETDDVLAVIEEDLRLLSEADFLAKWFSIRVILGGLKQRFKT
jgi:hypothetical protein